MISDTKDILYLVLAFCVLWFTIFVCWLLYYFIAIMREMRGTVRDLRQRISSIGTALEEIKEKFSHSLQIFSVVAESVKYVVSYLTKQGNARRPSASSRKINKSKNIDSTENEQSATDN